MSDYIRLKHEFEKWIGSLKDGELSDYEKKIINLIWENFNEIVLTTARGGMRGKVISSHISLQGEKLSNALSMEALAPAGSSPTLKRIHGLDVESFRGFVKGQHFDFIKQYTLAYGPNGSGKSSLCEALEFGMLGSITEAIERKIDIEEYIKNIVTKKASHPKLTGLDEDDKEIAITPDINAYRSCFIEKNRINKFARISAQTPSKQNDAIAQLFGLDEFDEFVDEFQNDISSNAPKALMADQLKEAQEAVRVAKEKADEAYARLVENQRKKMILASEHGFSLSFTALDKYLNGDKESAGEVRRLTERIAKISEREQIFQPCVNLYSRGTKLEEELSQYKELKGKYDKEKEKIKFKTLFEATKGLEGVCSDKCPVCETPIEQCKKHPYENAKEQLVLLAGVAELEKREGEVRTKLIKDARAIVSDLKDLQGLADIFGQPLPLPEVKPIDEIEDDVLVSEAIKLIASLKANFKTFVTFEVSLIKANNDAVNSETIKKELGAKRDTLKGVADLVMGIKQADEIYEQGWCGYKKTVAEFNVKNAKLLKKVEEEAKKINEFTRFADAYKTCIESLKNYKNKLPAELVANLSDLTLELYNQICADDKRYELLHKLELPSKPGDGIKVWFQDNSEKEENALHVLSEGHVKCLGLAILIAKNIDEEKPVIIFDDVVNAIDDDHRSGIRRLLFDNPKLNEKQVIITSHAEEFIKEACQEFTQKECEDMVNEITFLNTEERGVEYVKLTKHYLEMASNAHKLGQKREVLRNCRPALENIMDRLWKKLRKEKYDTQIKLTMRGPSGKPDLMTKVSGMLKFLKEVNNEKYTPVIEGLEFLTGLKTSNNVIWSYLNRGVHDTTDEAEFDMPIVKKILDSVMKLEVEVKGNKQVNEGKAATLPDTPATENEATKKIKVSMKQSVKKKQPEKIDTST